MRQHPRFVSPAWPFLFLLVCGAASLAGCEGDAKRCDALRASIEAKEAQLPRACQSDEDCYVVSLRPGVWVATSRVPTDAELEASAASYASDCEQPSALPNVFNARCLSYVGDDGAGEERLCSLLYGDELVNLDVFELPELSCGCASHSDCSSHELCQGGCSCYPACEAACRQVEGCGEEALASNGLGTDLATCIDVCEVNLADPEVAASVRCLATASCTEIAACLP